MPNTGQHFQFHDVRLKEIVSQRAAKTNHQAKMDLRRYYDQVETILRLYPVSVSGARALVAEYLSQGTTTRIAGVEHAFAYDDAALRLLFADRLVNPRMGSAQEYQLAGFRIR